MIEETGTIVAIDGNKIRVNTQVKTTCGTCKEVSHCGTSVIAKAFARKPEVLEFDCDESVQVGQQVKLGISENALLAASAIVYMVPLFTLIISALIFTWLLPQLGLRHEIWTILAVLFTNTGCFMWMAKSLQRKRQCGYEPALLDVLPLHKKSISVRQL